MFEDGCTTDFDSSKDDTVLKEKAGDSESVCAWVSVYIPLDTLIHPSTSIPMLATQLSIDLQNRESLELHHLLRFANVPQNHTISSHTDSHQHSVLLNQVTEKLSRYNSSLAVRSAWLGYQNCGHASSNQ